MNVASLAFNSMAIRVMDFSSGGYKVNFLYQKSSKFSLKNTNLVAQFSVFTLFDKINFQIPLSLKWCPIFESSPLIQNSKFNNFLWVCWFLYKNLSNVVPPVLKLHNPYCHTVRTCTSCKFSVLVHCLLCASAPVLYILGLPQMLMFLFRKQKCTCKALETHAL